MIYKSRDCILIVVGMRFKYDDDVDAAYIYLKDRIDKGEVKTTISLNDNIILDFDSKNKLIGIEVLNASNVMPKASLAKRKVRA